MYFWIVLACTVVSENSRHSLVLAGYHYWQVAVYYVTSNTQIFINCFDRFMWVIGVRWNLIPKTNIPDVTNT